MFLILDLFYHQQIARTAIAQGAVAEPIAPTPSHRHNRTDTVVPYTEVICLACIMPGVGLLTSQAIPVTSRDRITQ